MTSIALERIYEEDIEYVEVDTMLGANFKVSLQDDIRLAISIPPHSHASTQTEQEESELPWFISKQNPFFIPLSSAVKIQQKQLSTQQELTNLQAKSKQLSDELKLANDMTADYKDRWQYALNLLNSQEQKQQQRTENPLPRPFPHKQRTPPRPRPSSSSKNSYYRRHETIKPKASKKPRIICGYCQSMAHYSTECHRYITIQEREDYLRCTDKCRNCLGSNCPPNYCKSKYKCLKCSRSHHTSLHKYA